MDKLEGQGWVERVRNQQDRREVLIAITIEGNGALAKGEEIHKKLVEKSLSVLEKGEMAVLASLLTRLADATEVASHADAAR